MSFFAVRAMVISFFPHLIPAEKQTQVKFHVPAHTESTSQKKLKNDPKFQVVNHFCWIQTAYKHGLNHHGLKDCNEKTRKNKKPITMARSVFLTSADIWHLQSPPNGRGFFSPFLPLARILAAWPEGQKKKVTYWSPPLSGTK